MVNEQSAERFAGYVDMLSGSCWEWTAGLTTKGYGKFWCGGKTFIASRFAYALWLGPLSPADCVLHRCDNPKCVRPSHLFLGTKAENNADRKRKGRNANQRGHRGHRARLTPEAVAKIRAHKGLGRVIANEFGVAESQVSRIRRGLSW